MRPRGALGRVRLMNIAAFAASLSLRTVGAIGQAAQVNRPNHIFRAHDLSVMLCLRSTRYRHDAPTSHELQGASQGSVCISGDDRRSMHKYQLMQCGGRKASAGGY